MQSTIPRDEALRQEIVSLLPRLRRFARSLARDPDKADDLVQAACERSLDRLEHVQEGTRLDSWMYRIIYTRWIDKLRRSKVRSANLVLLANRNTPNNVDEGSDDYLAAALDIKKALKSLPAENHAAIMLVSVEGYSYEEAASVLDVPVGTVASRVARSRNMLGRYLSHGRQQVLQHSKSKTREAGK